MNHYPRELTRKERTAIKRLVVSLCANYDRKYGCLPLDCDCYMLNKWWTSSFCKYFQNAVLPIDSGLVASLQNNRDIKACKVCGKGFPSSGSQKYCSESCRSIGTRNMEKNKKRRQRQK